MRSTMLPELSSRPHIHHLKETLHFWSSSVVTFRAIADWLYYFKGLIFLRFLLGFSSATLTLFIHSFIYLRWLLLLNLELTDLGRFTGWPVSSRDPRVYLPTSEIVIRYCQVPSCLMVNILQLSHFPSPTYSFSFFSWNLTWIRATPGVI